jgi:diguanylate cyclase (GGDEF)-like protein
MAESNNKESPAANINNLSELIIEALKELSKNHQTLTSATLGEALKGKRLIADLLVCASMSEGDASSQSKPPQDRQEIQILKTQMRALQTQKERLLSQMNELDARLTSARSFSKRSLVTLLGLFPAPKDGKLSGCLNQFKALLMDGADEDLLEVRLNDLRTFVMKESLCPEDGKRQESDSSSCSIWSRLLKRQDAGRTPDSFKDFNPDLIRNAFLRILEQFQLDLDKEYLDAFTQLKERIRQSEKLEDIIALNSDLLTFIKIFTQRSHEDRAQYADFIATVEKDLVELERSTLDSLSHTEEAHRANREFNTLLEDQVEDINSSIGTNRPLAELRDLVVLKLAKIKKSLENKRKEDESILAKANRKMGVLQDNLQKMTSEISHIQKRTEHLEREAMIDALTGVNNRRAYERRILEELQRYFRYGQIFSLLLFDVDHFKSVNDRYGHWAGDKCLKEIIRRIEPTLRKCDFLARYGGEEFAVILPGTSLEGACNTAEKIRETVEKTRFIYQSQEIPLTVSVGVAQMEPSDRDVESIVTRVDKALYQAKSTGRNRTVSSMIQGPSE